MQVVIPAKLQLLLTMIRKLYINYMLVAACLFLSSLLLPSEGYAQFIDLRLDVDAKLTATTEKPLEFGTLPTNSGRRMIEFGSIDMGIFSITGLEGQMLLVTLNKPDLLRHENPAIEDVIPLQLFARYGYSTQDYQNSIALPDATSNIKVKSNPEPGPWNTIYIFMYGTVNIDNVPNGVYSNQIVLNVEYI